MNSGDLMMLSVAVQHTTGEVSPALVAKCLNALASMVSVIEGRPDLVQSFPFALTELRMLKR